MQPSGHVNLPVRNMPLPQPIRAVLRAGCLSALMCAGMIPAGAAIASEQTLPGFSGLQPTPSRPLDSTRYASTQTADGGHHVSADFQLRRGDALSINFQLDAAASRASMRQFGISNDEVEALREACQRRTGCSQAELEQALKQYYREHYLQLRARQGERAHLFVDIPGVVSGSQDHVRPVVAALKRLRLEHSRDAAWLEDAAISLVQSALAYRQPAAQENGRQTLGFYTPPHTLKKGYGDCDTKSALLAAILQGLGDTRVIGVRVPNHYLLGIARVPRDGESWIEYRGEPFVLLEAAGPAQRAYGDIAPRTRKALDHGDSLRIDPMF